jgi:hypothetical protein
MDWKGRECRSTEAVAAVTVAVRLRGRGSFRSATGTRESLTSRLTNQAVVYRRRGLPTGGTQS